MLWVLEGAGLEAEASAVRSSLRHGHTCSSSPLDLLLGEVCVQSLDRDERAQEEHDTPGESGEVHLDNVEDGDSGECDGDGQVFVR